MSLISLNNHLADSVTDLMAVTTDMAIEDGTYGNCKECSKEIPYECLEAIPTALTCVDHTDAENI